LGYSRVKLKNKFILVKNTKTNQRNYEVQFSTNLIFKDEIMRKKNYLKKAGKKIRLELTCINLLNLQLRPRNQDNFIKNN